jgi:two-component system OmpR family sensor kinase
MVVLVAAGLAAAAVVTYEEQRSFLLHRVDGQVEAALVPLSFRLQLGRAGAGPANSRRPPAGVRRPRGVQPGAALPPGTFGEVLGPGGKVLRRRTFSYGGKAPAPPALPKRYPVSQSGASLRLFTVGSVGGSGGRYRAAAFTDNGDTAVVAVSLHEADATLHRLVMVELLVGAGVIIALVMLGWVVIRIGLRPLERIGRVAAEIAGGDLSRRVTPSDGRTEVGRLGRALNEMLGQIERAFDDRSRSEARLRRFLADASHELRTPLAAIRGYAELFRIGAAREPQTLERAMSRIEAEAARMGVLVEDLLLLAQLDQAPEPRRVTVGLWEVAEQAVQDARVAGGGREIAFGGDGEELTVRGDPDRLRQVVANLLRNTIIHTPDGTPVEVTLTRHGDHAALSVRDHGPGLPAGDPERLFERFWRSEGGRRRGHGGAGLGLAIVRAIVVADSGTVTAGDATGGGALFIVELPLAPRARGSQESLSLLTSDS